MIDRKVVVEARFVYFLHCSFEIFVLNTVPECLWA